MDRLASAPIDRPATRARVLLVDDSATQGQQWADTLQSAGFRVFVAVNGRQALEQARRWHPDVIVSDVLMPVMDGFALCREVRRDTELQHVPLVLHTTSYLDPRDEEFALALGATRFMLKPRHPDQLLVEIRKVLKVGHLAAVAPMAVDDHAFLRGYSERLAAKLEDKLAELEAASALKTAILETAPDAIITIDDQGSIVEFNPAAEQAFGRGRPDVVGLDLVETIIPAHLRERYRNGLLRELLAGDARVLNQRLLLTAQRADETEFPVEATFARIPTPGAPLFTAFMRDITDRVRSEATTRHLAAIVESSNDAIIGKNLDGIVTSWNPGAQRLYGYTEAEIVGQPISILAPPEHADKVAKILARLQRSERVEHYDTVWLTRDGRRLEVSLSISPLVDTDGHVVGSATIARDISERIRAEAQIQALYSDLERRVVERTVQLEAANKELEAFSYSVSHDLRAPLRAVTGFSRILLQEHMSELTSDAQTHLQAISDGALHMARLIDDLLAFSRLSRQPLQKQHVLPAEVARGALDELALEQAGRAVEVVIQELPACEADPALLRQVYVNLLSNALKFTRRRSIAHIEVGCELRDDGEVVYFVKDDGAGFNMRYANKLFAVFQRLHSATDYEGTGVGLAIVQRIVYRHGGRIWAEAAPDTGATFFFTLAASPGN